MTLWPLVVLLALFVVLVGAVLLVAWLQRDKQPDDPELARPGPADPGPRAGPEPAPERFPADPFAAVSAGRSRNLYFMVLLFLIFDLQAALLFTWAVAAEGFGWAGYAGLVAFLAILGLGLVRDFWSRGNRSVLWGRPAAGPRATWRRSPESLAPRRRRTSAPR